MPASSGGPATAPEAIATSQPPPNSPPDSPARFCADPERYAAEQAGTPRSPLPAPAGSSTAHPSLWSSPPPDLSTSSASILQRGTTKNKSKIRGVFFILKKRPLRHHVLPTHCSQKP